MLIILTDAHQYMRKQPQNVRSPFINNIGTYLLFFLALTIGLLFFYSSVINKRSSDNAVPKNTSYNKNAVEKADIPEPSYRNTQDGWISYRNYQYSFEVSFPKRWEEKVRDSKDAAGNDYILLNPYDQGDATLIITFRDLNYDIWNDIKEMWPSLNQRTISQEKFILNGNEAESYKVTSKDNAKLTNNNTVIKGKKYTYLMMGGASPELTEYEYQKILNSFVILQ